MDSLELQSDLYQIRLTWKFSVLIYLQVLNVGEGLIYSNYVYAGLLYTILNCFYPFMFLSKKLPECFPLK